MACSNDEDPKPNENTDLIEITSHTQNSTTVTLFAEENFFVGYNRITARVKDQNGDMISGDVAIQPMMDMTTMQHSSPIEFPNGTTINEGLFEFNTVFVMPSGEMGTWSLKFTINEKEVSVPVEVKSTEYPRLVSFVSALDEAKYFVTMLEPEKPQVGQNELIIAVYERKSMMEWPAVTNLTFELEPWMVSMDHGSPNNVAPIHDENGHYKGKVNFTMTGDWQVRLTAMEGGEVCGEPYFDLYFQ